MANSDKDILITPNTGSSSADPKIEYVGADSSGNDTITVETLYDGTKATLSFEGSAGQLFSVVNDLSSDPIFSVNDVSGIPSIEVDSDGEIRLAEFSGNVGIGISSPTELLHVDGRIKANNLTLSSLSAQNSEATAVMIDGSGIIGTRELGSNAFNSTSYLTGNQTITLSGDVSGSGTTSISVTVADDSHNHVISNVDGLQTALDGKLSTSGTAANSQLLDSLDSSQFLRSDATDTATGTLTFSATNNQYSGHHFFLAYDSNGNHYPHYMSGSNNNGAQINLRVSQSGGSGYDVLYIASGSNDITWRGNKVWNAGNDGSGSGLDADTVDGVEANRIIFGSNASGTSEGTVTDWNSPTKTGFYSDDNASNKWSTANWSSIMHVRLYNSNNSWGSQLGFDTYNPDLYYRMKNNGTWTDWYEIYHEGHKPTYTELGTMPYSNLTGTPTIPSLSGYATESYVNTQVSNLVDSAPGTLDTLNELAAALGDDANFSTTVTNSIATKLPLSGGTITGGLTISGSVDSGGTDYGFYQSAGTNLILKGDSNGRSGIFFESEKNGTNINDPSDYGFIQYHPYGYGNTSSEHADMVIGIANDSPDHLILQSPYNGGVKVGYKDATSGTGLTTQTVFHDAYHPNADAWTTARTITLGGDLSGSVSINGSANVTLTATVADDSHNHVISNVDGLQTALDGKLTSSSGLNASNLTSGTVPSDRLATGASGDWWSGNVVKVGTDGVSEVGKYLDFHNTDAGTSDFDTRLYSSGSSELTINGSGRIFTDGYHPNADKWTTARTLSLTGDVTGSVSWDGSGNASITTVVGNDSHNHNHSDGNFTVNGVLQAGAGSNHISTSAAPFRWQRSSSGQTGQDDNVSVYVDDSNIYFTHNNDADGDASGYLFRYMTGGTATNLLVFSSSTMTYKGQTVFHDGYHPNADTLTTARTIGGVSFNGSANINLPGVNTAGNQNTSGTAGGLSGTPNITVGTISSGTITTSGTLSLGSHFQAGTNVSAGFYQDSANGAYRAIGTSSTRGFYFQSNAGANTYMYVGLTGTYAGRVGVGTASPAEQFHATGVARVGSLKIGTTTVIDSSRNITNIVGGEIGNSTDSRGILTLNHSTTATTTNGAGTGADIGDGNRALTLNNPNNNGTASNYVALSFNLNPTTSAYRCMADIKLLRTNTNSSVSDFVFTQKHSDGVFYNNLVINSGGDISTRGDINLADGQDITLGTSDTSNGKINLARSGYITFYGDDNTHHSIGSRDNAGNVTDDLTISSYGAVYIDLDSNNNNTSGADFIIARHGSTTPLYTLSGETGNITATGTVSTTSSLAATALTISGQPVIYSTRNMANIGTISSGVHTINGSANSSFLLLNVSGNTRGLLGIKGTTASNVHISNSTSSSSGTGIGIYTYIGINYVVPTYGDGTLTNNLTDLGNSSARWKNIYAGSNIYAGADVVAYSSSDERLKDNLERIQQPIEKIQKISGYEFDWNDNQDTFEGHDIGVVAQEVEKVLPEIVETRENGYKAVKYEKMVALLIEGMKEQQEQIKELQEQVQELSKQK